MGDESLVYTLDEALSALRFGKVHSCCALSYAGLGWFSEAMEMIILSFVGPAVKSKWGLASGDLPDVVWSALSRKEYARLSSELVPVSRRGAWMVVCSAYWSAGTIFKASLAWKALRLHKMSTCLHLNNVMIKLNWRWLPALSAVPSFALLLFYCPAPESPTQTETDMAETGVNILLNWRPYDDAFIVE
ncbi:hypothetical protein WN944_002639 [Citrus x changshan-huyou]|uniref:Uncharacterized protein n=1 Tax=Citrus x changshan-huyou TaxID=2935761 RepID=A0AAP0MGY1_9ROSI